MLVWLCFRKAVRNEAFNFSLDLGFLANCIAETNDLINRICSTMELKFYIGSISEDGGSNFLKPNKNYNLMAWVPGCEPGLLAVLPQILLKVPRIYLKRP
ncbi:hypothetical protein DsansV1_C05g0055281 [Dioscorea sansibarensis]